MNGGGWGGYRIERVEISRRI